jgi:hypothetical protein
MAEALVEFRTTVAGRDGTPWIPRACGRVGDDGLWEGWIEFTPADASGDPVRTPRETQQPNRDDLMYWAQGLTQAYLEAALRRALEPPRAPAPPRPFAPSHFDGPAPRPITRELAVTRPVLDPFEVYLQGEDVLVRELSALDVARLRDIVLAYGWASREDAAARSRGELTAAIMAGVRPPRPANGSTELREPGL